MSSEGIELRAPGGQEICDFCSSPDVTWGYPAKDVEIAGLAYPAASKGDWAACDACHALIVQNDRDGLATRSAEHFSESPVGYGSEQIPIETIKELLIPIHRAFWESRAGAAYRYHKGLI